MTIIYVEDDELMRTTVARRLRRRGLDVIEAESGEQGIELAVDTLNLRAVVLDVSLPGIDGVETYRRLKRLQPGLHAVVVSGSLFAGTRQSFLDLGVPEHCLLGKPCQLSQIEDALQSVL